MGIANRLSNQVKLEFSLIQKESPSKNISTSIHVHGIDQRVHEVAVFRIHPFKTNLFWSIFYCLYEWVWEPNAIQVHVENQAKPMYVKVDQLSIALGIPKRQVLTVYSGSNSKKEIAFCLSTINKMGFSQDKLNEMMALLKRVQISYLVDLLSYLETSPFKNRVIEVLLKAGTSSLLKESFKDKDGSFSCVVTSTAIEFKFVRDNQIRLFEIVSKGHKILTKRPAVKLDQAGPAIVIAKPLPTATKVINAISGLIFKVPEVPVPQALANLYVNNGLKAEKLDHVLKVIDCRNIVQLAETVYKDQQKKFLKTVLKVNACMQNNIGIWNSLFGSSLKYEMQDADHFEFAVNEDTAIVLGKKFAEGGFKEASVAHVLNTMQKVVGLKIEDRSGNGNIELTLGEKQLLDKIARNNPYMAPPYECVINAKDKRKLIMFQQHFDGNGAQLTKASPWQLCMAVHDTAMGLFKMHQDGYVHSDVKPDNLFFNGKLEKDGPIEARVADIGLAQRSGGSLRGGTIVYLPPEVLQKNTAGYEFRPSAKATPKIDSYSLGVTIFEFLGGFIGQNRESLCLLSETELNERMGIIQDRISTDSQYFEYERKLMIKLVNLARGLLMPNHVQRSDCAVVAKKLAFISQ